ncbi:RsmG family class I SAM-dependent methyltransferase, partial [Hungatella sp.]
MTVEFKDRLNQELNQFSIKLEDSQIIQFHKYYEILVEWNKVMNLTAITEQNEVITKHFVDSL